MLRSSLILAALLAGLPVEGSAQSPRGTSREQDACKPDVIRHCRRVMNEGDFAILGCLQQNRSRISRACRKVLHDNGQ
jgi:hypothetical protein